MGRNGKDAIRISISISIARRLWARIFLHGRAEFFIEWTNRGREAAEGHVAAIDCKTARRSEDRADGKSPIHVASAGDRE